nr:NACHT, LRR and PYD domains-containing protein 3-like [Misgurnus anguillicaudatus]
MISDASMDKPIEYKDEDTSPGQRSLQQKRSDSPEFSCVSMISDASMDKPIEFKDEEDTSPGQRSVQQKRSDSPEISCASMISDASMDKPIEFKDDEEDTSPGHSYYCQLAEVQYTFKSNLRKKFNCLYEGTSNERNPTLLKKVYTELYITESESGEISNEHEVRQIETQSKTSTEETPIKCGDIFKPLPEQDKHIKSVLTKGVAGIGKTVSVQKFIMDWAEEKENKDVHLIFPLPFREINLVKNKTLSFLDLLHIFFPETKEMEIFSDEYKVLFIFDGLDECRLSLDFHSSVRLCDVSESTSVDVMLTNLIKGNLFPSALIWITSRPAAADLIPSEYVDRVTEVRGFSDPQKEEYFRKRISDESLSDQIISHLKSSRSLYIMCHIPVFCWISVTVLERMLSEAERREIPKTLTQMYTHFLIIQTNIKHQKDYDNKVKDEDMIFKLGKLAYEQLVKGNLIFYDEDLRECGIDVAEASVYSGLCTQIFREEFGLHQGKVYCFVHLSIQEHLAALYAYLSFTNNNINVFDKSPEPGLFSKIQKSKQVLFSELHHRAINEALRSKNGHLDLFLRFLLGLSLESNQILLQKLLRRMRRCSYKKEKTVEYIKQKINENLSTEKSINLIHCLNELGDDSLLQEIQYYVKSASVGKSKLSSSQWTALVFVLLTSEQHLDELNLNTFIGNKNKADGVLVKLLPVIKEYKKVRLSDCEITDAGCAALTTALKSNPSHLSELDLSSNFIGDSGVKLISDGLKNPQCKLMSLRLSDCEIADEGCAALSTALQSNPSHLSELDLSSNFIGDSGVKVLSDVLENPQFKLKKLVLNYCEITAVGCVALSSALRSNPSHLRDLNLSNNNLRDSGVKVLSDVLKNPYCKLEILGLWRCKITAEGCDALTSALRSNPSHLTHLNLSINVISDQGVKLLSDVLENPQCKLKKLVLKNCNITDEGCVALSSALKSNPSHLTHLNLSFNNNLRDSGVKLLSVVLENPQCKLEMLELCKCNITDEGCVALTSALRSNPSHLRDLNLSNNNLRDSEIKLFADVLENPDCKLEILKLMSCNITDEGRAVLDLARKSNPSHLTDLKL